MATSKPQMQQAVRLAAGEGLTFDAALRKVKLQPAQYRRGVAPPSTSKGTMKKAVALARQKGIGFDAALAQVQSEQAGPARMRKDSPPDQPWDTQDFLDFADEVLGTDGRVRYSRDAHSLPAIPEVAIA